MIFRTILATAALISMAAITGCAGKNQYTGIDTAGSSANAPQTASAASHSTGSKADIGTETISDAAIADSSVGQDDPKKGGAADSADGTVAAGTLETIYFDFDAFLLGAPSRETLAGNARFLENGRLPKVTIEGHADERGSDDYNLALAEKRAVAVKRYLIGLGIAEERLESVSYGEDKPAVTGHDEEAWAKNRRVDFVIVK